ncbi:hypothetical protein CLIB1444_07S00804 [[Candida] jaroonii]|uniref:Uncharacterized protein n=1 Tax=[Candida] jaroonii TaxID=467808 RepID=A0ACA9YA66_9ASCO|nr:hypothetical protein CLIB1444_07S00804 [[Candida] jaroonii]
MKIQYLMVLPMVFAYQKYCNCEIPDKLSILETTDCDMCTRELCINHDKIFDDVKLKLKCYQIESTKEAFIVYPFILIVLALFFYSFKR